MSHFTVMVIGDDPEGQLAPFDENEQVEEYCTCEVSEDDKQQMLDYYKKERKLRFRNFENCYKRYGKDWNGNRWRKNEDGIWCEIQPTIRIPNGTGTCWAVVGAVPISA